MFCDGYLATSVLVTATLVAIPIGKLLWVRVLFWLYYLYGWLGYLVTVVDIVLARVRMAKDPSTTALSCF